MTTDRVQRALEKARQEPECLEVGGVPTAMLAVIEAAAKQDTDQMLHARYHIRLAQNVHDALNQFADAVLGDEP